MSERKKPRPKAVLAWVEANWLETYQQESCICANKFKCDTATQLGTQPIRVLITPAPARRRKS